MRLLERCEEDINGCLIWNGALRAGYGVVKVAGSLISAHRLSYELKYGDIPPGLFVLHKCNNKRCCNPEHLYAGTHSDNMKDYFRSSGKKPPAAGRFKKGNSPINSKYNRDYINSIRHILTNTSYSIKELSETYGISECTIKDIRRGKSYKVAC